MLSQLINKLFILNNNLYTDLMEKIEEESPQGWQNQKKFNNTTIDYNLCY